MNMPPPLAKSTFVDLNNIHNAYIESTQESMATAGKAVFEQSKGKRVIV